MLVVNHVEARNSVMSFPSEARRAGATTWRHRRGEQRGRRRGAQDRRKWWGAERGGRGSVYSLLQVPRSPPATLHRDHPRDESDCTAGRYPDVRARAYLGRDARRPVRPMNDEFGADTRTTTRASGERSTRRKQPAFTDCHAVARHPFALRAAPPSSAARGCARNPPHACDI